MATDNIKPICVDRKTFQELCFKHGLRLAGLVESGWFTHSQANNLLNRRDISKSSDSLEKLCGVFCQVNGWLEDEAIAA